MFRFWTTKCKHSSFRQLIVCLLSVVSSLAWGQATSHHFLITRLPANYVPDDDVIVKPIENEITFYQKHIENDQSEEVIQSKQQLKVWQDNQLFADQYGHDSTLMGSTFVPTPEEKWEFFKDRYMRYLRRKGEQPLKDLPKTWYNQFRASSDVDTIDEMEARFKSKNKKVADSVLPKILQEKEINLWKQNKVIFQPRLDQGLVVIGIRGPLIHARAWVGVNGRTELNVRKDIDSIGFRAMYNYESETGEYIASLDQRLMQHLSLRVTKSNNPVEQIDDETIMLRYAKQF
jgi:hypothetical protein